MDNVIIKNIIEKNIENSDNETQKEVQVTFETNKHGVTVNETITLTGKGSVKVLTRV